MATPDDGKCVCTPTCHMDAYRAGAGGVLDWLALQTDEWARDAFTAMYAQFGEATKTEAQRIADAVGDRRTTRNTVHV